jgi:Mrp family chromosome partitioning ATPase
MQPANDGARREKRKERLERQAVEIKQRLSHIQHKIMVMSGKGGVGKSSVSSYLAVALSKRNYSTGLLDVDLHGPSILRLLGWRGTLRESDRHGKLQPIGYRPNLEVMSIEALATNKDAANIWRGPMKGAAIRQFIADINWAALDFMIIDAPPGTGDEPLTVAQTIPDALALIVTTPQEISLADVRKSIDFCRQVDMTILGLVENMSGLICPHCGETIHLFKNRGGAMTASKENLRLLATLPFDLEVVLRGDDGDVGILDDHRRPITQAFDAMVDKIVALTVNAVTP